MQKEELEAVFNEQAGEPKSAMGRQPFRREIWSGLNSLLQGLLSVFLVSLLGTLLLAGCLLTKSPQAWRAGFGFASMLCAFAHLGAVGLRMVWPGESKAFRLEELPGILLVPLATPWCTGLAFPYFCRRFLNLQIEPHWKWLFLFMGSPWAIVGLVSVWRIFWLHSKLPWDSPSIWPEQRNPRFRSSIFPGKE